MNVRTLRFKIAPDKVADVETAAKELFTALESAKPQGVHYGISKLDDGQTFTIQLALDDPDNNPLATMAEFGKVRDTLQGGAVEPPVIEVVSVVGAYGLF